MIDISLISKSVLEKVEFHVYDGKKKKITVYFQELFTSNTYGKKQCVR